MAWSDIAAIPAQHVQLHDRWQVTTTDAVFYPAMIAYVVTTIRSARKRVIDLITASQMQGPSNWRRRKGSVSLSPALLDLPPFDLLDYASKLFFSVERGGNQRSTAIFQNAAVIGAEEPSAWEWALISRDDFFPDFPAGWTLAQLRAVNAAPDAIETARRIHFRASALRTALDWYRIALRAHYGRVDGFGGVNVIVNTANPSQKPYRE